VRSGLQGLRFIHKGLVSQGLAAAAGSSPARNWVFGGFCSSRTNSRVDGLLVVNDGSGDTGVTPVAEGREARELAEFDPGTACNDRQRVHTGKDHQQGQDDRIDPVTEGFKLVF
jgi:hypothetical protein